MTARETAAIMYEEIMNLSFLLCYNFDIDIDKVNNEIHFYAGLSKITPEEFDRIMSCYFDLKFTNKEVFEV